MADKKPSQTRWKPSLVPAPKDAVDAADAEIWWSHSDDNKVVGVVVASRKERLSSNSPHPGTHDAGPNSSDWLSPSKPSGLSTPAMLTPEGVFGVLAAQGFADGHELKNALVQFSRILGCDWARAMLFAFTEEDVAAIREEAARRRGG